MIFSDEAALAKGAAQAAMVALAIVIVAMLAGAHLQPAPATPLCREEGKQ